MPGYRFGKHPPKKDYRTLRFRNYLTPALAPPPASYDVLPKVYQKLSVAVTGDDLRRYRRRLQSKTVADMLLDARIDIRMGADRSRHFPNRDHRPRLTQPLEVVVHLV